MTAHISNGARTLSPPEDAASELRVHAKPDGRLKSQDSIHLLSFLLNPKSYPHRPRQISLIQTASSFVFIARPFVYKVKKPVNFGYLDYSTLAKRRHYCEREIMLNRRLCPDLYLGVVPITSETGRLILGEGGKAVEYAVKMRKLSESCFLHNLLKRGAVKLRDLERIATILQQFYQAQHPAKEVEMWGRIDRLKISTAENFQQTERFIGKGLSRSAFDTIRFYTDEFYERRATLFESRIAETRIRDCHGDLRLEHIHITPQAVHIYDCIEFNDRLRYLDVANDVAFLAMDFDYAGRSDLARYFATRMAAVLADAGMMQVIDFYKCYRAYVRGKVESLQSIAAELPQAESQLASDRARRFFRLALGYTVAGSHPLVLVIMGRVGSGKSTMAHALANELGWTVFSSDRIRKQLAGVPVYERRNANDRAKLYSPAMTEKTYEKLFASAEKEIRAGPGVILDATFARRSQRDKLREHLANHCIALRFVETHADDGIIKERLQQRELRSDEVSDARLEDFEMLARQYESPDELTGDQITAAPAGAPIGETVTSVFKALAGTQIG